MKITKVSVFFCWCSLCNIQTPILPFLFSLHGFCISLTINNSMHFHVSRCVRACSIFFYMWISLLHFSPYMVLSLTLDVDHRGNIDYKLEGLRPHYPFHFFFVHLTADIKKKIELENTPKNIDNEWPGYNRRKKLPLQ